MKQLLPETVLVAMMRLFSVVASAGTVGSLVVQTLAPVATELVALPLLLLLFLLVVAVPRPCVYVAHDCWAVSVRGPKKARAVIAHSVKTQTFAPPPPCAAPRQGTLHAGLLSPNHLARSILMHAQLAQYCWVQLELLHHETD